MKIVLIMNNLNIIMTIAFTFNNLFNMGRFIDVHLTQILRSKASLITVLLLIVTSNSWCFDAEVSQLTSAEQIDFSPNNIHFLSVDKDNSAVYIWRTDTKSIIYIYKTTNPPTSAKYSKDGTYIGIGMDNGNIIILTASTMAQYGSVISNPVGGAIVQIDFSWNSNSFIACSADRIKFLTLAGVSSFPTITQTKIYSCKLNKADGIGISYDDKKLRWFQYATNSQLAQDSDGYDLYYEVDFSTDNGSNTRLVSGCKSNNKVKYIKNGENGDPASSIFQTSDDAYTVCYSKDNNYLAVGDKSGKFYILNATNQADVVFSKYSDTTASLQHCRFSYDTQLLAVSSSTGAIYFYTTNCFPTNCDQGTYKDSNGVCRPCSAIDRCLVCSSASVCLHCVQGFYLNGAVCSSCPLTGCRSCEAANKCLECEQGHFLDYSAHTCTRCQSQVVGCLSCERNSTNATVFCRQCIAEYYLNATDSLCYPCVSNNSRCLRCNSSSTCLQCQMGYYADNALVCQPCASNCLICTGSASCIVCSKGYYANASNACVGCGSNCLDCYNTGACTNCVRGTFLTAAGMCTVCADPCASCNGSAAFCSSCGVGYYLAVGSCLPCAAHCLTCDSDSVCTSCEVGHFVNASNLCAECYTVHSNCSTCNSTLCLSCQSGYYLSPSNNCQSCASIANCYLCSASALCSQCLVGFYLSSGNCLSCPAQCASCTSSTVCVNCAVGFYFNSNACTACASPCVTCDSASNCLSCHNGYFLNTAASPNACTKCLLAIVGCVSCNSSSFCDECEVGRYVSGVGGCSMCPGNCSVCNASQCLSCSVGYYLSGAVCLKCQQNCSECASPTLCSSCNVGFYLNASANNCLLCPSVGCQTCTLNACLSCQTGFFLSASSCLPCNTHPNCLTCSESGCVQCLYGFYANSGVCTLCHATIDGCVSCFNSTVCSECSASHYLAANSTCAFCPPQCKTCESNVCTSCQPRYTFNAAQTDCLLCESFVKGCEVCNANNSCANCYEGYFLSSPSECVHCRHNLVGCLSCSNASFCTVCQDEYHLEGGVCVSCSSIQSCLYCANSSVCLQCASGYYLSANGSCSLCTVSLPGCIFCASSSTCKQCQSGYFLNSTNNQCQLCANTLLGCLSCLNSSKCLSCDGGYYLSATAFSCLSCNVTGCQVCGDSAPSVCVSCSQGFYLSVTSCLPCPQSGCLDCANASFCSKCDAGYYLSADSCLSCKPSLSACSQCLNATVCTQCDTQFFLNSSLQCAQCSALPHCEICQNSSQCTVCKSGYYVQGSSCLSCSSTPGCFMCLNSTVCLSCFKGYFLSSDQCLLCSISLPNCFNCANSSLCLSCQSGFILDASNNCNAVSVSGGVEPQPIPYLKVKTFYVNSQTLKHIFSAKQGYTFTKQTLAWSSVTTISLFNSATSTTLSLTITSVEWGRFASSIIFYTNNPLNINADTFTIPFARMLVTQNDFSLSYQTKFKMTQAALALLLPNQIIPNDYSQDQPLMEPSFYMSYLQNSGEYYFTIVGYVITAVLFLNFLVKATCTAPHSRDFGSIVPHVFSLKTCALMVFPIYPQVANFCFGLMASELPWLAQYYAEYLSFPSDAQPAGFQLFYQNMNFASLYLSAFVLLLLLLLLGSLSLSTAKEDDEVFSLKQSKDSQNANEASHAYLRMVYLYFGFGLTFAGAASIQGSIYNFHSAERFSINGLFYMLGGVVYCAQLGVTVKLTMKERRSCYVRSFVKASVLSVAHVSPVYICTVAFIIDECIVGFEFYKGKEGLLFPRVYLAKNTLANLCLVFLYYFNEKKIAIFSVIAGIFIIVIIEVVEHTIEAGQYTVSKKINPIRDSFKIQQITQEDQLCGQNYFVNDFKLTNHRGFRQSNTSINSLNAFQDQITDLKLSEKSHRTQKRHRAFRQGKNQLNMRPIFEQTVLEDLSIDPND